MKERVSKIVGIVLLIVMVSVSFSVVIASDTDPDAEKSWVVTQYGDYHGDRQLCYTVTSDDELVIVDGGLPESEELIREIIKEHDNHVDAWFLTHPHEDHIGAFLAIYQDPQGITIDHIYTPDYPSVKLLEENASWDHFERLEAFRNLSVPEHTYLYPGDTLEVIGLKVEVLSTYCDEIDKISSDLMNNGSMVFRLSGKEESMLFCGDIGSAGSKKNRKVMTQYMLDHCKDLSATYVQMSHHGFQGMKKKFYQKVNPKGAFMDSPDFLLSGENENFSSKENYDMMKEMGVEVYTYETAPNHVTIH